LRSKKKVNMDQSSLFLESQKASAIHGKLREKIYEIIIFDWDGTAVPDRHAPIGALKTGLEDLLKEGGLCAIVTGTNLDNILKQGIADLSPLAKHGLHICTNRGSEVFNFDSKGQPQLVFRRIATPEEDRALDNAVVELQKLIEKEGMQTDIVFNRLNRRKLDLIPVQEWSHPKKAQFRELLEAVESRMALAGFQGGISHLMKVAEEIAHAAGLKSAKITSDVKHIEIGLTDKSDAAEWITKSVITPANIPHSKVSVWGDELGSFGSLPGSDALMRIPELHDASFFSVGIEPDGVPAWVNHLKGGPPRFTEFLLQQAHLRRGQRIGLDLRPTEDRSWLLEQEGFDPSRERLMESLFAISNGNIGVRGASDFPIPTAHADLFVAGVYDQRVPSQPYSETDLFDSSEERSPESEIVPLPFPFRFFVKVNGDSMEAKNIKRLEYRRCLDFKKGVYFEENLVESPQGQKTKTTSFRICSHADAHLLIQKITLTSENYSTHINIDLSLFPNDLAELYPHLQVFIDGDSKTKPRITELQTFQVSGSHDFVSLASRIVVNGRELLSPQVSAKIAPGETLVIERFVSVFWSKTSQRSMDQAITHSKSQPLTLATNVAQHLKEWEIFWDKTDLQLPSSPGETDALRFNLYHLQSSAALAPQTSVPAKGLTGRAYEGHIFWDSEIFIFPFFLYTQPQIARQLLMYRYNTLEGARKRASEMGFLGASYAWESTVTGKDVTPLFVSISGAPSGKNETHIPIFTGTQELHITADIAWAVFKYWDATLDQDFMCQFGVEILIETARFWVSRVAFYNNQYHLKEIVGPDEYHHGVTDNAFTNWMVRHNLEVAIKMATWLSKEHPSYFLSLSSRLDFSNEEIPKWQDVLEHLFIPSPGPDGVIEQFEGFFELKPVKLSSLEKTRAPISRLFNWDSINHTRIVKQADVLMIPFLFPDQLPASVIRSNYDYYDPITDHGSSLSPCVYAAIAARIGRMEDALRYWRESLYFDLRNIMSNSQLGIHAASLGGTWQALVFHLLGVRLTEAGYSFDQNALTLIPPAWRGLKLKLVYRSRTYALDLANGSSIEIDKEAA